MAAMADPHRESSTNTPQPFGAPGHPLDFLGYLEPIGTYEDLLPHAESSRHVPCSAQ